MGMTGYIDGFDSQPRPDMEHLTDDELLIELRNRGRLKRMEGMADVPHAAVARGHPVEAQIRGVLTSIAGQIADEIAGDQLSIPGMTITDHVPEFRPHSDLERDRRVTIPINFVVLA